MCVSVCGIVNEEIFKFFLMERDGGGGKPGVLLLFVLDLF